MLLPTVTIDQVFQTWKSAQVGRIPLIKIDPTGDGLYRTTVIHEGKVIYESDTPKTFRRVALNDGEYHRLLYMATKAYSHRVWIDFERRSHDIECPNCGKRFRPGRIP